MRAFKLITLACAFFAGSCRAGDDFDEEGNPVMPDNPYGSITLDEIVRTGTLDGVNKPETPEEIEVFEKMKAFHEYSEATKEIDASFAGLMDDLNMDDLNALMKEMQGQLEGEFLASEMAKLDMTLDDISQFTPEQKKSIEDAIERLERLGVDLKDDSYFSAEAQQKRMDDMLAQVTAKMDARIENIMKSFDEQLANLEGLGIDVPGFEEWEKDFDLEKWRAENPEDAKMIDDMFAAPEGGYFGDIDLETMPGLDELKLPKIEANTDNPDHIEL